MNSQAVENDARGTVNLEYVISAEAELISVDLILCESLGDGDLHVANSDIVCGAVFAVDEVHHGAVCTNALNGDIAQSRAVLCIETECGVGIDCRDTKDVNVLDICAAILAVRGAEFKSAKASQLAFTVPRPVMATFSTSRAMIRCFPTHC